MANSGRPTAPRDYPPDPVEIKPPRDSGYLSEQQPATHGGVLAVKQRIEHHLSVARTSTKRDIRAQHLDMALGCLDAVCDFAAWAALHAEAEVNGG